MAPDIDPEDNLPDHRFIDTQTPIFERYDGGTHRVPHYRDNSGVLDGIDPGTLPPVSVYSLSRKPGNNRPKTYQSKSI